ncbi:unnamed protein product [Pelagomonas calceolata]|uniref:Tubulin--tyrosine ligase-like protein 9 n=1 Tax=Pelagomonas calceolata TaxID=35677 RepID=A0A8J2SNF8_9STRA|nr:unnamed protein product [Pelagomonas calceolata]
MALLQWGPDITGGRRFHIEDPNHEYQEVRRALHFDRGWARVGKKEDCELRWTLDERAIDFDKLRDAQMVNHYRDIRCLTTKAGLTRTLDEELKWTASAESSEFFPRSYALDDDANRAAFVQDFRRTACCAALKAFVSGLPALKKELTVCLRVCQAWAHDLGDTDYPGDDLSDIVWDTLLAYTYKCTSKQKASTPSLSGSATKLVEVEDPILKQACHRVLASLKARHGQFSMDGSRNIWLTKAPEACRGVGISLHRKLEEILEVADRFPGRVAQKYVENSKLWDKRKFDLRCWVLLTGGGASDFDAYIYEPLYARLCAKAWSLDDHLLLDEKRHLSNLAVNKGSADNLLGTQSDLESMVDFEKVKRGIRKIVKALARTAHQLASTRSRSFEFLGVDIILDEAAKPWLLECNLSPALARRNDAQSRLIDSALRGCIKRTIDRWCPETAPPPRDDGWRHLLTIEPAPKLPKRNRALHLNVDATALDRSSLVKMDRGSSWLSAYAVLRAWWPFAMLRRRALVVRRGVAALFIQSTVRRWRAVCELRRRQMARRRFLGAMQALIAGITRRRLAFTRFRRLRAAASLCSRVAAPRFYVRLYARRLRAARVAYDVACDAAAATDTTPAINAAARAAAAVAVWQAARESAARPLRNMMMKALCRRRVARAFHMQRRERHRRAATRLQTCWRRSRARRRFLRNRAAARLARFTQTRYRGAVGHAAFMTVRNGAAALRLQTAMRFRRAQFICQRRRALRIERARVARELRAVLRLQAMAHKRRRYVRARARALHESEVRASTKLQAHRRRLKALDKVRTLRARIYIVTWSQRRYRGSIGRCEGALYYIVRWCQRTYRGRRGRAIYALRRRLKRKHDARVATAIYLQKRWRGRTGREFYRRKRSAKLLVDFVRRGLWEKLQDRAFGGRPLPRMKRSGPGSRSGEPYALPPSEPVDEPTAETASVRTDDGEEMVAVRSDDSDEEFIQYLKRFEDPGAFIDFHTIGQPAWKLGEPPKKRKGKRKKKQVDGFINVPWNL